MQRAQHQTRSFPVRNAAFTSKWQWVTNTALVIAAFIFVGAVTLGLFP
ncbi:hypothetical protein [Neorhizobium petrolearium]|uniref:Uncharacterized protein n=1 Tax=Neorhizobium petrolearium TaxID=515361 RepID=A0ABY8LZF6_9HYPH|nr:hypothetical protein [Neorhizobium petrolearium]MCC2612506.1 hypothetical protein [Neorhizobium petrolearium]WGI67634.1 hypothetical protein QEO92_22020 [Neorhizobium petrolearium]